jgi:hypothetical protein
MNYPIICYSCEAPAEYKVAAEWSDGQTRELKTYALSCAACLAANFAKAKVKQAQCRLLHGETLAVPGIYAMNRGTRDMKLDRRNELEI